MTFSALEICAGGGGQALGLHRAGFHCAAAVEIDSFACRTLEGNGIATRVLQEDLRTFSGKPYEGIDLLAGGVPCPPFSKAGKQLGKDDDRDLFPEALRLAGETRPRGIMLENVPGFAEARFTEYRTSVQKSLAEMGYTSDWRILQAADFGVSQLRPRFLLVALKPADFLHFRWPVGITKAPTVGETLLDLMRVNGWQGADRWAGKACRIAPTVVGGSKLHGGPDLGPTRAKRQWLELGVDGMGIANDAPAADLPLDFIPRLTVRMVARLQSFPDTWHFAGGKTAQYRQVGNAFPPNVAWAVAGSIRAAFMGSQGVAGQSLFIPEERLLQSADRLFPAAPPVKTTYRRSRKA